MGGLSIWHWLIVLAVVLLLFGTGKVSNLMGEFGKGIKTFKKNIADDDGTPKDASMSEPLRDTWVTNPGSLNAPLQSTITPKSTVNQG
jgi:sec-independent protein translocase protein TatA